MYNLIKVSKCNDLHSLEISLSQLSIILLYKPLTDAKDKLHLPLFQLEGV